ncbi:unnamed protein product [Arctogadus glacialis]
MWLRAWLLWAGLLHTWADCARHAEQEGRHLCAAEQGSDGRSKGHRGPKERAGEGQGPEQKNHHVPPHKMRRTQRRKELHSVGPSQPRRPIPMGGVE